jgi:F-type H+-transporting ATPase subunit c
MRNRTKKFLPMMFLLMMMFMLAVPVCAANTEQDNVTTETTVDNQEAENTTDATSAKAIGAALAVGLAAAAGAFGMGMAISKSAESIARQPEAEGKIRTSLMLGLVFIETAIIYALIIGILIIFVL